MSREDFSNHPVDDKVPKHWGDIKNQNMELVQGKLIFCDNCDAIVWTIILVRCDGSAICISTSIKMHTILQPQQLQNAD